MIYIPDANNPRLFHKLPGLFLQARKGEEVLLQFNECVYRLSLAGVNVEIMPDGKPKKIHQQLPASFSTPPLPFPKPNPEKG